MNRAETIATNTGVPSVPMTGIWRTIRGYILWSYERGTIQYDVMVTLILLFVFLSPRWINFNDKPVQHNPHPSGVVVMPDGQGGLIYQVEGSAIAGQNDGQVRGELLRIIEPISGEVSITNYEAVRDRAGHVLSYKVWVHRE
ncbi:MAG: hypothetical protein WB421_03400 [Terriglobales bacterium]